MSLIEFILLVAIVAAGTADGAQSRCGRGDPALAIGIMLRLATE